METIFVSILIVALLGTMLLLRITLLKDKNPNADLIIEMLKAISGADNR